MDISKIKPQNNESLTGYLTRVKGMMGTELDQQQEVASATIYRQYILGDRKGINGSELYKSEGFINKSMPDVQGKEVQFYISATEIEDRSKDIVSKTAFDSTIKLIEKDKQYVIKQLYNHDFNNVNNIIGKVKSIGVDAVGVYAISVMNDSDTAKTVLDRYKDGTLNEHSFWAKITDYDYRDTDNKWFGGKVIKDLHLMEVSTVPFGANKYTPFIGEVSTKGIGQEMTTNEAFDILFKGLKKENNDLEKALEIYKQITSK